MDLFRVRSHIYRAVMLHPYSSTERTNLEGAPSTYALIQTKGGVREVHPVDWLLHSGPLIRAG